MSRYIRLSESGLATRLPTFGIVDIAMLLLLTGFSWCGKPVASESDQILVDQAEYWEWLNSARQNTAGAVDTGLSMLADRPNFHNLFLKIALLCVEVDRAKECSQSLRSLAVADTVARLYREAALAMVDSSQENADENWKKIAFSRELTPALARVVVDQSRRKRDRIDAITSEWNRALDADSTQTGALFGLGYLAALEGEWEKGRLYLSRLIRLAPDDPEGFHELGRIYFFTGSVDAFVETIRRGIEVASLKNDFEKVATLKGNLGLAYLNWIGDLNAARELFEEAQTFARRTGNWPGDAGASYRLAFISGRLSKFDEALVLADSAESKYRQHLPDRIYEVLILKGQILTEMLKYVEAEEVLLHALESRVIDVVDRANALNAIADLKLKRKDLAGAYSYATKALNIAEGAGLSDYVSNSYIVLGDISNADGKLQQADAFYRQALSIATDMNNVSKTNRIIDKIGILHFQYDHVTEAQGQFEKMLQHAVNSGNTQLIGKACFRLACVYRYYGNATEALRYYDQAIEHLAKENIWPVSLAIAGKADFLQEIGAHDESLALLRNFQNSGNVSTQLDYDCAIGQLHLIEGRPSAALEIFRDVEARRGDGFETHGNWYYPHLRAVAFWRLKDSMRAEESFRQSVEIIESWREQLHSIDQRSLFVQKKVHVYEDFSAFLESEGRLEDAFEINERALSRSLVDLLYSGQQERAVEGGAAVGRALSLHARALALEQEMLAISPDGNASLQYSANRTVFLMEELEQVATLIRGIEADVRLQNPVYSFDPLSLESVKATLGEGEALIVFNLRQLSTAAGAADASVVYVLTPQGLQARPLEIAGDELAEAVRFFRDQISRSNRGPGEGWEPLARRLYAELMQPVLDALPAGTRHLNIVPEGILHYLPFAALLDGDGRHLVERFTLSVVPSATTLKLCRDRNPRRFESMLIVADPTGRLPGASHEARVIPQAGVRSRVLAGDEARQDAVEELAGDYDVIHFATHGRFVRRAPGSSFLELHDGPLTVDKVGRLRLAAYLVTLSACETALGSGRIKDIPDGEEWVGLNQAFIAAGTPSVLASLWSIDDRISASFMKWFYEALSTSDKAQALAAAQRRFIEHPRTRHPFYWAAFSLTGDPR